MIDKLIELFEYEKYEGEVDLTIIDPQYFSMEYINGKNYLKAKQFVGVAQFGDTRICVYPKIYRDKLSTDENGTILSEDEKRKELQKESMQNFKMDR